ncbi:hypothetical protein BDA99DRAFT_543674 [Phascolomyces articulosus]|uniref:Uncharacterized protein n=1 Tax=Phascolomyces articulosus TaxID=60185 RepID=A0AAD5JMK0_9FUNG|nr:hypothetical protein BDA99DRAFT_543674 [Phascolomyces articulosus]
MEMDMTAKAASFLVRIKIRTGQHYVRQYKIENELPVTMTGTKKPCWDTGKMSKKGCLHKIFLAGGVFYDEGYKHIGNVGNRMVSEKTVPFGAKFLTQIDSPDKAKLFNYAQIIWKKDVVYLTYETITQLYKVTASKSNAKRKIYKSMKSALRI